jgi:FkbM family methyltransferase
MIRDDAAFYLARLYSAIYAFAKERLSVRIPGLGFALRRIRHDRVISVASHKMYFDHRVAASYSRLIAGSWNEPETHSFLNYLIPRLPGSVTFIDVGANIGEMVVDVAQHKNVSHIVAFEPLAECCDALRKSLALNSITTCEVIETLVGATNGQARFAGDLKYSGVSSVYSAHSQLSQFIYPMTTLDDALCITSAYSIMLVDVEGYEPLVLQGGTHFIQSRLPIVIFEYNQISQMHFTLKDIEAILGTEYAFYRLRQDGRLDGDVEHAWNCVALPRNSVAAEVALPITLSH